MNSNNAIVAYIDPGTGMTIVAAGGGVLAMMAGFLGFLSLFFKKIFDFLKKNKKIVIILIITITTVSLIFYGDKYMKQTKSNFKNKVIILGFDGLSPRIVESMMNKGELPNFAKLKENGSYSQLSTTNPPQSPVAWAGFATGKNPGKNGVFDFITRNPQDYSLSLSLSKIEKGKPLEIKKTKSFWHYTSEQGINNVIIGSPVTFPPDKIKGKMLSGMGVPDILGTEGTFSFYTTEPEANTPTTGGKIFYLTKSSKIESHLLGPKVTSFGNQPAKNSQVPLIISLKKGQATLEFQKQKLSLKPDQWSDWQEVEFKLGSFKKVKGILKFYLVSLEPELQLYVTPINFDPRDPFFNLSYPKNYSQQLVDQIGLFYTQGMPMDTWAVNEKRLTEEPFLIQVNEILAEKQKILDLELKQMKDGLLFVYFESPDIIQHMFWRYTDPQHPLYEPRAKQEYKNMITDWYIKMDQILGQVIKETSTDDLLIVISDHGMDTFRRSVHLNSWLRDNGYLKLNNSQKVGKELLSDIDWTQTQAYSIGFGAIYINQQGREAQGIIKPGKETENLKQEISNKLKQWQDKNGQSVVNQVYPQQEIFWGDYAQQAPDLYVGFNIGYRASWQTALGAVPEDLIEDNLKKWSGSHLFDPQLIPGILFINKSTIKDQPSILDIAPTILDFVGFEQKELTQLDFDGQSLF